MHLEHSHCRPQLYNKFRPGQSPPSDLGRDRDYAVDLIPKYMMANGELTKMLVHTDVTRYLEFKQIAASYVYRDGRIAKVPATEMEAVRSALMGLFEKRRAKKFFEFLQNWRDQDPATHQSEWAIKNGSNIRGAWSRDRVRFVMQPRVPYTRRCTLSVYMGR